MTDYFSIYNNNVKPKVLLTHDDLSKTDLVYGSYILNSVLPTGFLQTHREWTRLWTQHFAESKQLLKLDGLMLSGSAAEYFNVPLYMKYNDLKNTKEYVKRYSYISDQDVMFTYTNLTLIEETHSKPNTPFIGTMKQSDHPGYVLIVPNDNTFSPSLTVCLKSGVRVLDGSKIIESIKSKMRTQVTLEGPALALSNDFSHLSDYVLCFTCQRWPSCARDWITRTRLGNWPTFQLIQQVTQDGCHVVRMGHINSRNRDFEFRLSFSKAEVTLAHTLLDCHRRVYLYVKLLHNLHLKEPKALATYHLKTTLYWMVEQEPNTDVWKPCNTAVAFLRYLDRLLVFLKNYNIPNYFVPENNMIDHVKPESVREIVKKLERIRIEPIKFILAFFDEYTLTVPEEPYAYCPPREELCVWKSMINGQRKNYDDQSETKTAILNFHRCSLHLVLSWLIEFTVFCRAQNIEKPTKYCRQMFSCIGDTLRTAYEHKIYRTITDSDLPEFKSYISGEITQIINDFVHKPELNKVNITDVFYEFLSYLPEYKLVSNTL
ncbi:uncharacterized protein LOC124808422 [Hydra vulgaris]|uniref:uncharacterized protein LOC124808422 n=1 Tax=Hydra vulgaris TaxID=6087 RepID=UPI001F5F7EC6|nr:uncharacterized protein LOC124808422 [Hydra vulgaris]